MALRGACLSLKLTKRETVADVLQSDHGSQRVERAGLPGNSGIQMIGDAKKQTRMMLDKIGSTSRNLAETRASGRPARIPLRQRSARPGRA